jgi:sporulation protein YlmC with PRC-barrel domain
MRKILMSGCALAALTGFAIAQEAATKSDKMQAPASVQQPNTSNQTTSTPNQTGTVKPLNPQSSMQQGGVQRVDASSLVMTFYAANPADTRASKLIGRTVYNLDNESIGEVSDLIIDNGKTIKAIVVGVGGFLGIGERDVAIAPASIVISELKDGSARLVVNTRKEDLKNAAPFNFADVDRPGPHAGTTTGSGASPRK